jgi:hypothetical protein
LSNSRSELACWNLVVRGTDHQNFCDVIHLCSQTLLMKPSSLGPANPNVIGVAMDRLLVSYFLCAVNSPSLLLVESNDEKKDATDLSNTDSSPDPNLSSPLNERAGQTSSQSIDGLFDRLQSQSLLFSSNGMKLLRSSLMDPKQHAHCFDPSFFNRVTHPSYRNRETSQAKDS